jgi:heat shock protein HtpX
MFHVEMSKVNGEQPGMQDVDGTTSYSIETEIPAQRIQELMEFIDRKYIAVQPERFANVSKKIVEGNASLTFTILDVAGKQSLIVEIIGSRPIKLNITRLDNTVTGEKVNEVKQDVVILAGFFEEQVQSATLFFAWREGEEIVPEKLSGKEKKPINRLFLETQILLSVIFISVGMFLFFVIGWLAPIVLLVFQLVFVFFSNKFIARAADWRITQDNPYIHLLEYHLPIEEHEDFRQKYSRDELQTIKKEMYEETLAKNGEISCETVQKVLATHGFECKPQDLSTRKVNVYQLVKKTVDNFGLPMPEIVVSNTIIPNAAASGPSPTRGVVLITTGLLVQLSEEEILTVLGHEFGHLKGRDPLLLYGLTAAEFLLRFYVFLPLFPLIFFSYLFLLYFWGVMTVIFFIAKFFEARADLVSAIVIGKPKVLAEALEKIGFKRLLYERTPSYRFQEWINLDPHPPIYFRVARLEKLEIPVRVKHPLAQSASDVIHGFLASF